MSDERIDPNAEQLVDDEGTSFEAAEAMGAEEIDESAEARATFAAEESAPFVGDESAGSDGPGGDASTSEPEPDPDPESELPSISTSRSEKRAGDSESDSAAIPDELPSAVAAKTPSALRDWSGEISSRAVAVELKRIESEVRSILQDRDPRRKRKLAGTHRWEELEEDLLSWQFSGPIDDATNKQLRLLVRRRHYLFNRLRFLARTRPTWNS